MHGVRYEIMLCCRSARLVPDACQDLHVRVCAVMGTGGFNMPQDEGGTTKGFAFVELSSPQAGFGF